MKASDKQASGRGMNQTSTEELIKQLENRLDWLTSQPAEDMNEEEIENILNLLDMLKPLPGENTFNPEEAFERLEKDYLHNPEKLEQASEEADRAELTAALREKTADIDSLAKQNAGEKATSIPVEERGTETKNIERKNTAIKKHRRFRVLKNVGIAAAIMILVFSGLNLATYATTKKGLFDLIINRKNTMSNMYVGDGDMGMEHEIQEKQEYTSWDDVPDEIKKGVCISSDISDMNWKEIRIIGDDPIRIEIKLEDNNQNYVRISIKQFDDTIVKNEITNPKAEFRETETIKDKECYIYKFEDENILFFINEDKLYYIYGTVPINELKEMVSLFK